MKNLIVERVDVWAATIEDKPGGLAKILNGLRDAGADLDFVIARRAPEKPGTGVVFVTPLRGDREVAAASTLGFNVTSSLKSLRIEGENKPGVAAAMTGKLADAGINLHGLSAAVIGTKFIIYISLDNAEDAAKAADIIKKG
ncbi:MAG: ACT domain-containing protein [Syntrophales bacterium]|nr:ACT domain-containing protein [Syntrophales bacterium]